MALVRWSPLSPIFDDDMWPGFSWSNDSYQGSGLDIYETDDSIVAEAQVPGIPEDAINVSIEGNILTISADHEESEESAEKDKKFYRRTQQRSFSYTANLPRLANTEKADAEVVNGVVKITIPKSEEDKPRRIEVKKKS